MGLTLLVQRCRIFGAQEYPSCLFPYIAESIAITFLSLNIPGLEGFNCTMEQLRSVVSVRDCFSP